MEEDKNMTVKVEQQEKVLFQDVCSIIEQGRQQAYANISHIVIATYWNVGRRIVEEELRGLKRAAYGTGLMKNLSESLIPIYGKSYSKRNLDYYKKFYLLFPDAEIVNTCVHNLEWSHPITKGNEYKEILLRAHWRKIKYRLKAEGNETLTNRHAFKLRAADTKMHLADDADTAYWK